MKPSQISIAALLSCAVYLFGSQALALDTDVYLKSQSLNRDDTPNVVIILDTSGSMNTTISSAPSYDPSVDYCKDDLNAQYPAMLDPNSGKPTTCAVAGRTYWSLDRTPPATTSADWFTEDGSHAENKCIASYNALSGASGTSGFFSSRMARWNSTDGWQALQTGVTTDANITYVDCSADNSNFFRNKTADGLATDDGLSPLANGNGSSAYTNGGSRTQFRFTRAMDTTLYTANYLNYWNNAQLREDVTRIKTAEFAAKSVIDANAEIRFGLMVFNSDTGDGPSDKNGGRVIFKADTMTDARRTAMDSVIDSIVASGSTPLAETLWEAYSYYSGSPVDYGDDDPSATPARDTSAENNGVYISPFAFACQKAYVIYITDGDPTNDSNADSKIENLIGTTSCDGSSCLDDLAGWMSTNDVDPALPDAQTVSTYTVGFGSGISAAGKALLQQTATKSGGQYYDAADAAQLVSALQNVFSHILDKTISFTSPSLSVNAFNRLFNRDDIYLALFHPSDALRWDGNVKKYKICTSTDIQAGVNCQVGDILDAHNPRLKATDINNQILDTARSGWSAEDDGSDIDKGGAGENVPLADNRTLLTYTGSYSGLSASSPATPINLDVASAGTNAFYDAVTADPTLLGLPSGAAVPTDVDKLIEWIRGKDAYDQVRDGPGDAPGTHTGNTTESKAWRLGDVVHSRPVAITYGGTNSSPIIKLFFGTNDGMIHMIRNDTGVEQWAFMPQEEYGMQYSLSQSPDGDHLWGMDNSPTFWVIDKNQDGVIDPSAGDRVYMFATMRRGGRNIYGFDVTPAAKMTSDADTVIPKLMWVIQGGTGDFANLGQTWSRPLISQVHVKCSTSSCDDGDPNTPDTETRTVLLFAGGYDTNEDGTLPAGHDPSGNAIYMVDPLTGKRLWWASNDTSADLVLPRMTYAIPSDLAVSDTNGDNAIDRIYVGDMGGQIWRIDLSGQIDPNGSGAAARNGGSGGYVFADVGCGQGNTPETVNRDSSNNCPSSTTAQNRRKFFFPPDIAPVQDTTYSTTPNYDAVVIGSGDREDPLDFLTSGLASPQSIEAVHNRIYLFRDYNYVTGVPQTTPPELTVNDLYNATANLLATATGTALSTEISALKSSDGWYIDLQEPTAIQVPNGLTTIHVGEKVLAKPTILDGVAFVTTFTPANNTNSTTTCSAQEGVAKEYALNVFTAVGAADFNNDGTMDRFEQVGGGIPSEVVPIYLPDGTTGLVQTSNTPVNAKLPQGKELRRNSWKECQNTPDAGTGKLCGE